MGQLLQREELGDSREELGDSREELDDTGDELGEETSTVRSIQPSLALNIKARSEDNITIDKANIYHLISVCACSVVSSNANS